MNTNSKFDYKELSEYLIDAAQRTVLYWDVMRRRGNQYLEEKARTVPHVLQFDHRSDPGRPNALSARELRYRQNRAAQGDCHRRSQAALCRHRSARGSRTRHRRFHCRQRNRRGPAGGSSLLLYRIFTDARTRADHRGRDRGMGRLPRTGHRPARRGRRQAGGDRQLPGGLGIDDAGGKTPRTLRAAHRGRIADVILGRRARGQSHALHRRYAGGKLADGAVQRSGAWEVRRRLAGAEFREPQPGQHPVVQAIQPLRKNRYGSAPLSGIRTLVGRAPCSWPARKCSISWTTSLSATSSAPRRW